MTLLDCSVTSCVYNEDRCCCKGDIQVEGEKAAHNEETCCGSFKERRGGSGRNGQGRISKMIDVACEACKCVFNEDKKCSADHIGIAGGEACSCGETECASFRCND